MEKWNKVEIKPVSDDLLDVIFGKKIIGYLPLQTIEKSRISLEKTIKLCKENNINYKKFENKDVVVFSGAFVCWNNKQLIEVLNEYKDFLIKDEVPVSPEEFVNYIFFNWIDENKKPNSYKICGFLYGDKSFTPLILE